MISLSSRNYWKSVRLSKQILARSSISEISVGIDGRPQATIEINNFRLVGLLDSGANISCFGSNAVDEVARLGLKWKRLKSAVKTADGASQAIVGYVDTKVRYGSKIHVIRFYLIPSLSQSVYLGIDFWKIFGLAPMVVAELDMSPPVDPNVHSLNVDQSARLQQVIRMFPSSDVDGLGKTDLLQHSIDTPGQEPIKQRFYAVSPAVQNLMDVELNRMLSLGVIEESQSPWSSPVVLIRKDTGKNRLCLDSRALNKVTTKDAYPLPLINGLLSRLGDTHFISSIDLKDAFWQIELDEESRAKTAFTVPGRPLYHFRRMPFGLCNAAQTMSRLMDKVMGSDLRDSVFVYIDDLLVVSPDLDSHLVLLQTVANRLRMAKLTINVSKSKFVMREIRYLGYVVGRGQLRTDPLKVKAISDFPQPVTVRQVRRFLGMTGWYQRFIRNFSAIAAPLTDLVGKTGKFVWTDAAESAFDELKNCLSSAPVLRQPDFSRPFYIQCDASTVGVGSVLFQVMEDMQEHPIAFHSKKLNSAQKNYSITELECYAAVLAVKNFRAYVEMMPFTIITDHASLKWLMKQKDLGGRLCRWSLKLQAFNFEIEHRKGTANIVPDALSRMYVEELGNLPADISLYVDLDSPHFDSDQYETMKAEVRKDPSNFPNLTLKEPHLYHQSIVRSLNTEESRWKLWIPSELVGVLISRSHDPPLSAHRGVAKTIDLLRRYFYWPTLAKDVNDFVQNCGMCKETKAPNQTLRPLMGKQFVVERPWQRIFTDLLGPYPRSKAGNTHLLIVLDQFSKFVLIKPLRKANASSIISFIESNVFHFFGVPEHIFSDNGVQYVSREFAFFLKKYGVTHTRTAIYSPQANASERVNRSILSAIRAEVGADQRDWDVQISSISAALRNNVHESTGFSPFYLVFGHHMIQHGTTYELLRSLSSLPNHDIEILPPPDFRQIVHSQVKANLLRAHQKHERAYNMRSRNIDYQPGQEVYRRIFAQSDFSKNFNAKLGKQWAKARIRKKKGGCIYDLEDLQGKPITLSYHAKDLKQ